MSAGALMQLKEIRRRFTVVGVVQGVGFRPFVHRVATELALSGFVGNDSSAVFVEVQGPASAVAEFARRLRADAPPLAAIAAVSSVAVPVQAGDPAPFQIEDSRSADGAATPIPPDIAICDNCVAELFDPADRRYRHPFVTCTDCGPRFTIIRQLPYDRPATTMSGFAMCERCATEYHDVTDRRFHAQPIACPDCGPALWFRDFRRQHAGAGRTLGTDAAIAAAQQALAAGAIVAVKGIGGYHLSCSTGDEVAVAALRQRKARGGKPFAVMVRDLEVARRYGEIGDDEAAVLTSRARPIVLVRRRANAPVAPEVAPGSPWIGLLLPYSPIHHLLMCPVPGSGCPAPESLVLTSANLSDQPICYTDDDAVERLPALGDAVLDHNRPIHVPCDDSVVRVIDGCELPIRRSRGYAPLPIALGDTVESTVLAVGGELKNTFCLTDGRRAYCSAHIGDMGSWETLRAFEHSVAQISGMRGVPTRLAADLHPAYLTRSWAERNAAGRPVDLVQHHHAHVVSLLAEHSRLGEPVIGIAFDGTGYGTDGTIWGGEILALGADSHRFARVGHLAPVALAGGDTAVRNPCRMALSYLRAAGIEWDPDLAPVSALSEAELRLLGSQLASGTGCVPCTSMGRLFDAVASLLGVRHRIEYEGQAAIELEVLAGTGAAGPDAPQLRLTVTEDAVLDPAPMLRQMVGAVREGVRPAALALAFHRAVAEAVGEGVDRVAGPVRLAGLTGGVFQNVLLLRACRQQLTDRGFEVLVHRTVPPNDGGLALGQAAVSVLTEQEAKRCV
ncbi:hydrogenase maturation factor, HypF [Mycolicibacterium mageritense DSM 44476 = CIP 104973]|uniref:Carbamoyltransferase n=1 Tax=Mycolicibacterium mageritense TaxID=53462 RepID=A0AAI8TUR5_MYCME|nr:carbamoyltransferase HypF [Mycolicibacterium mageritense]MBN3457748.1 carbamoyltransferase HypF [Mycobacterium sp. DSM 3803]OKH76198.1 hydrogenase maturation protein HypF [Mycobacterium sp. SWH-M3]MCC9181760.1 carbamoyltransferase HypF [Mycolicibacterium mageritense]CDO21121.1 hydrogenase maturation factor, HypF [Mycolicibacterium mageritense DSM 44476 = CIP 104973]BBX34359.1 carbamoyltransferase [Mycolicibacterium mageritense]